MRFTVQPHEGMATRLEAKTPRLHRRTGPESSGALSLVCARSVSGITTRRESAQSSKHGRANVTCYGTR